MLREMMNQTSIETSPEVLKQQLEEEEKKTQSLSIMLQSCIDDNDTVRLNGLDWFISCPKQYNHYKKPFNYILMQR